jgi:hypothetical protein
VQTGFDALREARHSPDVEKVYGFGFLPDLTRGRRDVKRLTGESFVPVLVLDHGELVTSSADIVAWAQANPADATRRRQQPHASVTNRGAG